MTLSVWLRRGLVAAALGVCALGSQGQTPAPPQALPATPPPGSVPQPAELQKRALPERSTDGQVPAPPVPRELGKPGEELTIDVSAYSVDESAPARLRAALPGLTQRFTGSARSYEDLVNAASAVTRYLQRELGFYLGYAYLPEQVPVNGVIRIAVLEGRLDEVILNWPEKMPVGRAVVEAYLARLKPGEILHVRDVERIVFLVNDLRGLTARFEVKAGRTPGTASLVVTAQPEVRLSSRVEVDSLGSRYSGVWRANVQANVASPAGRGDGLVVNLLSSFTRGLEFVLAGYTLPVGADGLKVGVSGSYVRYQLDEDLLDGLSLNGDATTLTAYGLYPVVRSRNLNLFGLVSLDSKQFNDKQFGRTEKKSTTDLTLSISGDARDDLFTGGVNTFELIALRGKLDTAQQGANANPPELHRGPPLRFATAEPDQQPASAPGQLPGAVRVRQSRQHGAVPARRSGPGACVRARRRHRRHRSRRLGRASLPAARGVARTARARVRVLCLLRRRHDQVPAQAHPAGPATGHLRQPLDLDRHRHRRGLGPAARLLRAPLARLAGERRSGERREEEPTYLFPRQQDVLKPLSAGDPDLGIETAALANRVSDE